MRRRMMAALLAAAGAGACSESMSPPTQPDTISLPLVAGGARHAGVPHNHLAHLTGNEEVFVGGPPTPADSQAQGQAIIRVAADGQSFDYRLIASNITNVIMAHIHCGAVGANGPIVIWLYPSPESTGPGPSGGGRHDGVLASGTVTPSHVRTVPADHAVCTGGVATFDDVLEKIRSGDAYVNVHTNDGVGAPNTGPGDFPGGEIRGQLR